MSRPRVSHAFVAIELVAIILVLGALAAVLAIGAGESRRQSRVAGSISNLQQFAAGTSAFAADNADRVFSFSWRQGELHQDPDGFTYPPAPSDLQAAANQAISILRTRAHRPDITQVSGWIPHIFYNYLALVDYMGTSLPAEYSVSPSDHTVLAWHRAARVPADSGAAFFALRNRPQGFDNATKRWAYTSSYRIGPAFVSPDAAVGLVGTISQNGSGHRFFNIGGNAPLGQRRMSEVAYPANKAMLFEGYPGDASTRASFYFYDRMRTPILFADGSASVHLMADANPGFDPASPTNPLPSRFPYQPDPAWEPPTLSGNASDFGEGRIQWTRSGLRGRDFGGPEVPWVP